MIDLTRKGHWDQFRMEHYSVEDILRLRAGIKMGMSGMQNSMRLIKKTYPDVANTMGMDLDGMQKMYEELLAYHQEMLDSLSVIGPTTLSKQG